MKLLYKNNDIYNDVHLNECVYESYCCNQVNKVRIVFDDSDHKFEKYNMMVNDSISVEKENIKTKKMYIERVSPMESQFEIVAYSVKSDVLCARSHKSWKNVMFKQIIQDMAKECGLTAEFYGVKNQKYQEIDQKSERDLMLVSRLAALESCVVIIWDDKMIVASEPYLEAQQLTLDMEIDSDDVSVSNAGKFKKCVVMSEKVSGKYSIDEGSGTLTISSVVPSTKGEADRFAKGLLRKHNKNATTAAIITDELISNISGGSLINIETSKHPDIKGKALVTHVRHDLTNDRSKIWIRTCLEGY